MRIQLNDPDLRKKYNELTEYLTEKLGAKNYALFGQLNVFNSKKVDEKFMLTFAVFTTDEAQEIMNIIEHRQFKDSQIDTNIVSIMEKP